MRLLLLPLLRLGILHREPRSTSVQRELCALVCARTTSRAEMFFSSWVSLYLNLLQSCAVVISLCSLPPLSLVAR